MKNQEKGSNISGDVPSTTLVSDKKESLQYYNKKETKQLISKCCLLRRLTKYVQTRLKMAK